MSRVNRVFPAWKPAKKGDRIPGERAPRNRWPLPKKTETAQEEE